MDHAHRHGLVEFDPWRTSATNPPSPRLARFDRVRSVPKRMGPIPLRLGRLDRASRQQVPSYRHSPAFNDWRTARRSNVDELRRAHALVGNAGPGTGAGRPPKAGTQQLNEALVLRTVTEFQGFVRDLLDLAAIKIVRGAGCSVQYQPQLISAATRDRMIDRGNPHLDNVKKDAGRLGIAKFGSQLAAKNKHHATDTVALTSLVELRNALVHDDQDKVLTLSKAGVRPTLGYVRASHTVLTRHARALDRVVWDHLVALFPTLDPWNP